MFAPGCPNRDLWRFEKRLYRNGVKHAAGVDEVGRGPLAGPVVAAAVILPPAGDFEGVADSKVLSARRRAACDDLIRRQAVAIGIGLVDEREIDEINILQAAVKAMQQAVSQLDPEPEYILVDGIWPIPVLIPQEAIPGGDGRSISIAAASIIAKVYRDALMDKYHEEYPQYNFARHKGYATKEHLDAIQKYGCCPIHRRTFRGVKEHLAGALQSPDGRSGRAHSLDLFTSR